MSPTATSLDNHRSLSPALIATNNLPRSQYGARSWQVQKILKTLQIGSAALRMRGSVLTEMPDDCRTPGGQIISPCGGARPRHSGGKWR
ncbi:hypothetical protein RRG08_049440 [Elysia crispata]|uniref:Uncharacterized protein n=1 Tax=Elysia crispata TaxID=231223 RepID=A0AAE0ZRZ9_9GAST|nr:hypothetical protein RRG08_049440 [Elysia crispata]